VTVTAIQSGVPGHDKGTATIRLRLGTLRDDRPGWRAWDRAAVGPYEIICRACGDDPARNYAEVPPEILDIRGNYVTLREARDALAKHTGQALTGDPPIMPGIPQATGKAFTSWQPGHDDLPPPREAGRTR
jgi:hypothetical protein